MSLFDVAAEWMSVPLVHAETGDGAPVPVGLRHPSIAPYGAYQSADGALTLLSIQNEVEWQRLCVKALQMPELEQDPRFINNMARVANRDALELALQTKISSWDSVEFRSRLGKADIAYGAMNSVTELAQHRALRRREVESTSGERLSLPAHPFHNHSDRSEKIRKIPTVGQHSDAIRKEFAQMPE